MQWSNKAILCALLGGIVWWASSSGQSITNAWSGVYSKEQAQQGRETYHTANCYACHAEDLRGGPGVPGAAGVEFMFKWNGKSVAELFDYLKRMMPPGQAGSLADEQYLNLVALILETNGLPAAANAKLPLDAAALQGILLTTEQP